MLVKVLVIFLRPRKRLQSAPEEKSINMKKRLRRSIHSRDVTEYMTTFASTSFESTRNTRPKLRRCLDAGVVSAEILREDASMRVRLRRTAQKAINYKENEPSDEEKSFERKQFKARRNRDSYR